MWLKRDFDDSRHRQSSFSNLRESGMKHTPRLNTLSKSGRSKAWMDRLAGKPSGFSLMHLSVR